MNEQELKAQIEELRAEVERLKGLLPLSVHSQQFLKRDVPVYKRSTSGSPTTNGSITVELNGIDIKLMTTS